MKKTAFTFLLSLAWRSGFSQTREIDSLKKAFTLARHDVKAHGGELKVESVVNEGSGFIISLPI